MVDDLWNDGELAWDLAYSFARMTLPCSCVPNVSSNRQHVFTSPSDQSPNSMADLHHRRRRFRLGRKTSGK